MTALRLVLVWVIALALAACSGTAAAELPANPAEEPAPSGASVLDQEFDSVTSPGEYEPGPLEAIAAGAWRLQVPAIGLDAPIVDVGLDDDGAMAAPAGPDEVGWYRYGGAPGSAGNALLGGHVDWTDRATGVPRGAVFYRLRNLSPGSLVVFTNGVREYVYEVSERRRYRWDDPAGAEVLQPTADSRLTLITCGGVFDRASRSYNMRDVVIAMRVA